MPQEARSLGAMQIGGAALVVLTFTVVIWRDSYLITRKLKHSSNKLTYQ